LVRDVSVRKDATDLSGERFASCLVEIGDGDDRSSRRERASGGGSQAGSASRDKRSAGLEIHSRGSFGSRERVR
jgi:hypothetical protein